MNSLRSLYHYHHAVLKFTKCAQLEITFRITKAVHKRTIVIFRIKYFHIDLSWAWISKGIILVLSRHKNITDGYYFLYVNKYFLDKSKFRGILSSLFADTFWNGTNLFRTESQIVTALHHQRALAWSSHFSNANVHRIHKFAQRHCRDLIKIFEWI